MNSNDIYPKTNFKQTSNQTFFYQEEFECPKVTSFKEKLTGADQYGRKLFKHSYFL